MCTGHKARVRTGCLDLHCYFAHVEGEIEIVWVIGEQWEMIKTLTCTDSGFTEENCFFVPAEPGGHREERHLLTVLLSPSWGQATAILHYLGIDSICMWMSVDNEEISLAVCNLLQTITDCLLGQGKEEHHGKEEALVLGNSTSPALHSPSCSRSGPSSPAAPDIPPYPLFFAEVGTLPFSCTGAQPAHSSYPYG